MVSHIRVSPEGDLIAFLDHDYRKPPFGKGECGRPRRTCPSPHRRRSFGPRASPGRRRETRCGSLRARTTVKTELWAVTLAGREHRLWYESGPITLLDVTRDGRVLLSRLRQSREMVGVVPGANEERELSWLDWSTPSGLSEDGLTLLFSEAGEGAGQPGRAIYVRKTDGSPAIRLGKGRGLALAPDGRTVLASTGVGEEPVFRLLPIGPGTVRSIPMAGFTLQVSAGYFPDGRRIAFVSSEPGHGSRLFVLDTAGGLPRAISGEGVSMGLYMSQCVSPDGRFVAATGPDRRPRLYPVEEGEPREVPGVLAGQQIVRWTNDGHGLYVRTLAVPTRVDIVDTATGRRSLWRELSPADRTGVSWINPHADHGRRALLCLLLPAIHRRPLPRGRTEVEARV